MRLSRRRKAGRCRFPGTAVSGDQRDPTGSSTVNIGYYQQRYGDVPQEDLLGLVRAETLSDESKRLLLHGMQNLVSALAEVPVPAAGRRTS